MARPRRTGCRRGKGDRDHPTVREGVLPERRQPRARAVRRRELRRTPQRGCRFRVGFERTKARRGGLTTERSLSGGSAEADTYGNLGRPSFGPRQRILEFGILSDFWI